jgi:hypothetical protein
LSPTAIGIAALSSSIRENQVFTVNGNLYDTTTFPGVNVSGKTLHVSYNGVPVGDVVTGSQGYSLNMSIPTVGTYRIRVDFDGDANYLSCSHTTPEFTVTAQTVVSISVNPTTGNIPFTVNIIGQLTTLAGVPIDGKPINLYNNGILISTTTTVVGNYFFSVNITAVGQYQFQTEFPGDAAYEGCTIHNGTHGLLETKPSLVVPLLAGGLLLAGAVWLLKG